MPIPKEAVRVGHCYAAGGERRRVTAITDGRVQFEAWRDEAPQTPPRDAAERPDLEAFARAADREIPCPDPHPMTPSKAEG